MKQYRSYCISPSLQKRFTNMWTKAGTEYKLVAWPWNSKDGGTYIYLVEEKDESKRTN